MKKRLAAIAIAATMAMPLSDANARRFSRRARTDYAPTNVTQTYDSRDQAPKAYKTEAPKTYSHKWKKKVSNKQANKDPKSEYVPGQEFIKPFTDPAISAFTYFIEAFSKKK